MALLWSRRNADALNLQFLRPQPEIGLEMQEYIGLERPQLVNFKIALKKDRFARLHPNIPLLLRTEADVQPSLFS